VILCYRLMQQWNPFHPHSVFKRSIRVSQQTSINSLQAPPCWSLYCIRRSPCGTKCSLMTVEVHIFTTHIILLIVFSHTLIFVCLSRTAASSFLPSVLCVRAGGVGGFSAIRARQGDWQHFFMNWFCIRCTCWCVSYQNAEWAKLENLLQNWRSLSPTKLECFSFIPSLSVFNTYTGCPG